MNYKFILCSAAVGRSFVLASKHSDTDQRFAFIDFTWLGSKTRKVKLSDIVAQDVKETSKEMSREAPKEVPRDMLKDVNGAEELKDALQEDSTKMSKQILQEAAPEEERDMYELCQSTSGIRVEACPIIKLCLEVLGIRNTS